MAISIKAETEKILLLGVIQLDHNSVFGIQAGELLIEKYNYLGE